MATQDLWGEFPLEETVRTPLAILREQATLLGQKTENVLQGRVSLGRSRSGNEFVASLYIEAPALDDYSYLALTIRYPVALYPVLVVESGPGLFPQGAKCDDEESFVQTLGAILSHSRIRQVIASLIAQSRENG